MNIPTFIKQDLNDFTQFGDNAITFNLAKQYVLYYPINQNEDVYTQIEADPNLIKKLRDNFIDAINVYDAILKQP